ncbi:MAG: sigma-54 dependent transcriptional regulator [Bacteroidales bacterium]|jgi:DNA-binding NtrC family response regulator|nr:sigma-54 dependent transcriptional regulator [Bacteroidales bacterium]
MTKGTVLIVDDDVDQARMLADTLRVEYEHVIAISTPERIKETLRRKDVDVVIMESNYRSEIRNGNEGLYWLKEILAYDDAISVVILTTSVDTDLAVRAIKEGAVDFILKPWERNRLVTTVSTAIQLRFSRLEASSLKADNSQLKKVINNGREKIVQGASPTMINVMNIVRKVAGTDANVLITGENGTGKELIAREIHRQSARSAELMVSVDMGSIAESLIESELFGHVRGAFTDAREERKGKFETAHNGTLFLDEIGNLSLPAQSKLLNVLQNRQIVKVGSNRPVPVNIRLICATNCDIMSMVREGTFREDLLYRINTITIEVPPLRDRVDDIPVLARHFLKIFSERYGRTGLKISLLALEKLANHDWPGNVRELQHTIEKAVIMSEGDTLRPSDFSFAHSSGRTLRTEMTLDEMEKRLIAESLRRHCNNISIVADRLGITRQTLYNKIAKYNL